MFLAPLRGFGGAALPTMPLWHTSLLATTMITSTVISRKHFVCQSLAVETGFEWQKSSFHVQRPFSLSSCPVWGSPTNHTTWQSHSSAFFVMLLCTCLSIFHLKAPCDSNGGVFEHHTPLSLHPLLICWSPSFAATEQIAICSVLQRGPS